MAKFCYKCGTPLNEGAKFCPSCGTPVPKSTPPVQQAQTQQPQQKATRKRGSVGQAKTGFFAEWKKQIIDYFKHPKKLIPAIVLSVIWTVFSLMSGLGANIPALRFLYTLTYSNGGMYGGFFGAIGGIFGKALFVAVVNSFVLALINRQNPFKGIMKGFKGAAATGLSAVSPYLIGGGAGILLYWFFNITSAPINSAAAVVGAVAAVRAAGSQSGVLFSLTFTLVGKLSKGKAPSRAVVSRLLTGLSAGFAVSFPITFARYPIIIFSVGALLLAAGIVSAVLINGKGQKTAAIAALVLIFGLSLAPFFSLPVAAEEADDYEPDYVMYNGRLTYSNGQTNKYGQPFPDIMDFDEDGDIDYADYQIRQKLVHNPDYLDQPGSAFGAVAVSITTVLLGAGGGIAGSALGGIAGGAASEAEAVGTAAGGIAGGEASAAEAVGTAEGGIEAPAPADNSDLGPYITRDGDGDLVTRDPATGEQNTYVSNGDGTYTNPLTGATYTETELKDALDSRAENAGLIRQDEAQAKKAVEEQRAANQDESFYSTEARAQREAAEAKEREKAEHDAYVKKVGINHGVYVGDEKDVRKAVIRDQMDDYQKGAEAEGWAEYMDAGYKTAKQTEKAADVALDVLEKFDKTGTAKLVKDGYQAGKAYGQGLMEVATGEKSFTGAMSAATVKTSAEIAKNHAGDWAGGGVTGFAAEGTANITGDGVSATADSLARGKSLEKALKEGNKAAKQGAMNFAVDKTVDFVGGKVGDAVVGEGGGDVVGHLLDSEVTKDGVKEAASAFAADEIKNSLEDDD